jgi:predicted phage gp36 major capsid-like protein
MYDVYFWAQLPTCLGAFQGQDIFLSLTRTIHELQAELQQVKEAGMETLEESEYRVEAVIDELITQKHRLLELSVTFTRSRLQSALKAMESKDASVTKERCVHLGAICDSLLQKVEKDAAQCDFEEVEMLAALTSDCRDVISQINLL